MPNAQMNTDYNKRMKEVLALLPGREGLLLHTCCAVCAGGVLAREFDMGGQKKRLCDYFDITLYFYNPNIDTEGEYLKRAGELEKLRGAFGLQEIVIAEYRQAPYLDAVSGLTFDGERGERCGACIGLRLDEAARYAAENGFSRVCSTLSVSPHKDPAIVNEALRIAAERCRVPFLPADFKKENGFLTANRVAKELNIYRQNYCGCGVGKGE